MIKRSTKLIAFIAAFSLCGVFVATFDLLSTDQPPFSKSVAPLTIKLWIADKELAEGYGINVQPEEALRQLELQWKKEPVNYGCGTCNDNENGKRVILKLSLLKQCHRDEEFRELALKLAGERLGYSAWANHDDFLTLIGGLHYQADQIKEFEQLLHDMHQAERLFWDRYFAEKIRNNPNYNPQGVYNIIDEKIKSEAAYIKFLKHVAQANLEELWKIAILDDQERKKSITLIQEAKSIFLINPDVAIPFLKTKLHGITREQEVAFEILSRLKAPDLHVDIEKSFQLNKDNIHNNKINSAPRIFSEDCDQLAKQLFFSLRRLNNPQSHALYITYKKQEYLAGAASFVDCNARFRLAQETPSFRFRNP